MADNRVTLYCCNPFGLSNHSHIQKGLRPLASWMFTLFPEEEKVSKICDICRKKVYKMKEQNADLPSCDIVPPNNDSDSNISVDSEGDPNIYFQEETLEGLNTSLQELGETPIKGKNIKQKKYSTKKFKKVKRLLHDNFFAAAESSDEDDKTKKEEALMTHLKDKFPTLSRKKKLMLLTILPENWSIRQINKEFNAPVHMVKQAKKLVINKGILSTPDQKVGKSIPIDVVLTIRDFYESDDISRAMPGMKDCVSVQKKLIPKRLLLLNLREAFCLFKETNPNLKIEFSKFASLRPKNCVLAGSSGTHTVCVCSVHQNIKLMIENAKLSTVTSGAIQTYKDCLQMVMCTSATNNCSLGNCDSCPGVQVIDTLLQNAFEEQVIETVMFKQWVSGSAERCTLQTVQNSVEDFTTIFCDNIAVLRKHDFIAKQQSSFLREIKENLPNSEIVVIADFSENYGFLLQDETQSFHWSNNNATIHPFVVYFKGPEKINHFCFVIISDCLEHNTVAVYTFQKELMNFLKLKFTALTRIHYFSDGSSAQYKNKKNFINLCYHFEDFGVEAEWHFFATAHGKGPCDGAGGTVKRLARKASIQRPYTDQIMTPIELYNWAKDNISGMDFYFVPYAEYIESEKFLNNRFQNIHTIKGTQKLHAFIPMGSTSKILTKLFSKSEVSVEERLTCTIDYREICGYVTAVYGERWWVAYVLAKNDEDEEIKLTFLHPSGPSLSYKYPEMPDVLWIPAKYILCLVHPVTATGRTYALSKLDHKKAEIAFLQYNVQ